MVLKKRSSGISRRFSVFSGGAQKAAREAAERLKLHERIDPRRVLSQTAMRTLMAEAIRDKAEKFEKPGSKSSVINTLHF